MRRDVREERTPKKWENRGKKIPKQVQMTRESKVVHHFCHPELVSGSLKKDAETSSAKQAGQNASPLRHASTGCKAGGQGISRNLGFVFTPCGIGLKFRRVR